MELRARVFWAPFKIVCSLITIPRVILGGAHTSCLGGFGAAWVGALDRDVRFWASSPSETTSFSATHVCLCSAVMRVEISLTP